MRTPDNKVMIHRHELLPIASTFVELPMYGRHSRGIVAAIAPAPARVAPCPVR